MMEYDINDFYWHGQNCSDLQQCVDPTVCEVPQGISSEEYAEFVQGWVAADKERQTVSTPNSLH